MRAYLTTTAIAVLLAVAAPAARAQPGTTPPAGPGFAPDPARGDAVVATESYRGSVIKVDSAVGGLMIATSLLFVPCLGTLFEDDDSAACTAMAITALAGAGLFVIGSPIVHLSKDNPEGAALALLLRAGLPAASILLAETGDNDDIAGLAVMASVPTAMLIDWFALAKRDVTASATFVPTITPTANGANVGIAGSF